MKVFTVGHVDFKELAHKITFEWKHYLNLMYNYTVFRSVKYSDELYKQHKMYVLYTDIHKSWCAYLNYLYEFKCNLNEDLVLDVNYLDMVGIWVPGTEETICFQVVFDGECDSSITMSLNGQYAINVGGLPSGTLIFTKRKAYIIEGDEIVEYKS